MPTVGSVYRYIGSNRLTRSNAPDGKPWRLEIIEDNPALGVCRVSFRHGIQWDYSYSDLASSWEEIPNYTEELGG